MSTPSIYHTAIELKKEPFEVFCSTLSSLTNGIFNDIVDMPGWKEEEKRSVILYVIYAYSKESKLIVYGASSEPQKQTACSITGVPDYLVKDVCRLENEKVRGAVQAYLEYQQDRDWRLYMFYRDLYEQMLGMTVNDMRKDVQSVDFKKVTDAAFEIREILKMIKDLEKQFKSEYKFKDDNMDEIKNIESSKPVTSLRPENNPEINKRNS